MIAIEHQELKEEVFSLQETRIGTIERMRVGISDEQLRGEIARYCAVKGVTIADVGRAIGIGKTAMYERYNEPSKFRLREHRLIQALFSPTV